MANNLLVNEIFDSIEGEGIRQGRPCTFIRLAGCNLRCNYCDTKYAQTPNDGTPYTVEDIMIEVTRKGHRSVTITGGEPYVQTIEPLVKALEENRNFVNIETNGSFDLRQCVKSTPYCFHTVDYKLPSSGCREDMYIDNFKRTAGKLLKTEPGTPLTHHDIVKFVVGSEKDFVEMRRIIMRLDGACSIFITPVDFGDSGRVLRAIAEEVMYEEYKHYDIRVGVQLHKIIWPEIARGV